MLKTPNLALGESAYEFYAGEVLNANCKNLPNNYLFNCVQLLDINQ